MNIQILLLGLLVIHFCQEAGPLLIGIAVILVGARLLDRFGRWLEALGKKHSK